MALWTFSARKIFRLEHRILVRGLGCTFQLDGIRGHAMCGSRIWRLISSSPAPVMRILWRTMFL